MEDNGHRDIFMLRQAFLNVDRIHMSNEIDNFTSKIHLI